MECLICSKSCPHNAIEIDDLKTCIRLLEIRPHSRIIEEKCDKCGICNEVCPMGNISLSAESCSHCIICRSRPNCILARDNKASLLNTISSLTRLAALVPRFIF